ncbi:MAG: FAD-dependent oxidoreductase [Rickettsiales bacterium]
MPSKKILNPEFDLKFYDLYEISGLEKIHQYFLDFLQKNHYEIFQQYQNYNHNNSQYLIELAKILEFFLAKLFIISSQNSNLTQQYLAYQNVAKARKDFVQRHIAKKYSKNDLVLIENFNPNLFLEKLQINSDDIANIELKLSAEILNQNSLEDLEKYAIWALFSDQGKKFHEMGMLFILPKKIDKFNLINDINIRNRKGFNLTDNGYEAIRVAGETDYCIYCHLQNKDSCTKGLKEKNAEKFIVDDLKIELSGCPLDEKISEMNLLKNQGFNLASLAIAVLDNPLIAGTGHRICNDCMKSCIFQKQDPVDIPQIESRVLKDVLHLPFGFEIYSLLTRWNPLNILNPLAKKSTGKKILICGLGPSGFTLSHYLLNEGHEVVGIDGLKIEPLNPKISGVDEHHQIQDFEPIENITDLYEPLENRLIGGFGGVVEYGITARFDKNYLKIIRLLLERRRNFSMYGGLRFGSSITDDIAFEKYGFNHVALCVGAGRPQFLDLKNNFAKGVRLASDFLMALQLTGAYQENLFTNLQIRSPIIVVGGGLTAVDTATEAQEYYKVQIEKFFSKIEKFKEQNQLDDFLKNLSDYELEIMQEFQRDRKLLQKNSLPNSKILYRKKMIESPAYRLNHEELKKALQEGVEFVENQEIAEIIVDKFNHVSALKTKKGEIIPCKTLLMAIGTMPNLSFVLEDNLDFANDGKYLKAIDFKENNSHSAKENNINFITKINPINLNAVSFFGDLHPNFEGNVVRAMASAKKGYLQINNILNQQNKLVKNNDKNKSYRDYHQDFLVNIEKINRLSDFVIEVEVKSYLLASQTKVGQIFRLHNYHALASAVSNQTLAMEGVVITALKINQNTGIISGIIVETGGSTSLIQNFKAGEPCVFMGPSGKPTEIPQNEVVMLVGGGRGNQPLTALAKIFRLNGCKVIFFAGYRSKKFIVNFDLMQKNCDELIISIDENSASSEFFHGNVIDSIKNYFSKNSQMIDRIFAIGNDNLMHEVAKLRLENIVPALALAQFSIASLNANMQCMMKGVCGQCLQKRVKANGEIEYFFSCASQDQNSDELDFQMLHDRCMQNSLLEKTTKFWIKLLK